MQLGVASLPRLLMADGFSASISTERTLSAHSASSCGVALQLSPRGLTLKLRLQRHGQVRVTIRVRVRATLRVRVPNPNPNPNPDPNLDPSPDPNQKLQLPLYLAAACTAPLLGRWALAAAAALLGARKAIIEPRKRRR